MSDVLKVKTSHVRKLAELQETAAQQAQVAHTAAQGVGSSMMMNHGVVCATSNGVVVAAELARAEACAKMTAVSSSLSQKLETAASQYDRADAQGAGKLGEEMHPR